MEAQMIISAISGFFDKVFSLVLGNKELDLKGKEIDATVTMNYANNAKSVVAGISNKNILILVFIIIAAIVVYYINKTKK